MGLKLPPKHLQTVSDTTGHRLLDGFAGLWCVNTGYGRESIVSVAMEQMRRLPYATGYFHFGSEPAIRLASKLAELAAGDLNHVFFTLGGSDAVDTAIRMVRYYNNALGRTEKKHFIALERGYHGSTSNGAGLTALPVFHDKFDLPRPWQHHIPLPYPYRHQAGPDERAIIAACVQTLRAKVAQIGADRVAAFICEPVQGSGGVIVPRRLRRHSSSTDDRLLSTDANIAHGAEIKEAPRLPETRHVDIDIGYAPRLELSAHKGGGALPIPNDELRFDEYSPPIHCALAHED